MKSVTGGKVECKLLEMDVTAADAVLNVAQHADNTIMIKGMCGHTACTVNRCIDTHLGGSAMGTGVLAPGSLQDYALISWLPEFSLLLTSLY